MRHYERVTPWYLLAFIIPINMIINAITVAANFFILPLSKKTSVGIYSIQLHATTKYLYATSYN